MKNKIITIIQSLLCCVIYVTIIYMIVITVGGKYITEANSYIELISTKEETSNNYKIEMGQNGLKTKPEYGKQYGKVLIESANIELPLFFGNSLGVLKYGIGQSTRSYCPGEGKTIILNGHNTENMLKNIYKVKQNDNILINTEYGTYIYKIYDMKVMSEKDIQIQTDKEILIIYTNYPENSTGNTNKVYAIFANLNK